jgi:glycosyltransferase involved in cell wall biosynthesis
MKIAQVASLWSSVPPKKYGGSELIVSTLTDELVRRGHKVTLFASGDSKTIAHLAAVTEKSLGPGVEMGKYGPDFVIKYEFLNNITAFSRAKEFDLIHCHSHYLGAGLAKFTNTPTVHTLHSYPKKAELDIMKLVKTNYCAISDQFRRIIPEIDYVATVYNGIPIEDFKYVESPYQHLVSIGRLSPKKGIAEAIQVAIRAKRALKIATPVPRKGVASWMTDLQYYQSRVKPFLRVGHIDHVGEISHSQKSSFYNAKALLFPIDWEEPFGLVVVEAMACGTPVIAFRRGAVAEIVEDGKTGLIVEPGNLDAMVEAVRRLYSMSENEYLAMRKAARSRVERYFTVQRMTDRYEQLYEKILRMA